MNTFDAFFLPGFDSTAVHEWQYLEAAGLRIRWPLLTGDQIEWIFREIRANRSAFLIDTPVADIVMAIDATVARMTEERDQTAQLVSSVTGYTLPVVIETLDHMFEDWRANSLDKLLVSELGDKRVLDRAVPDPRIAGKQNAAFGFNSAFHIFSGNVPGVAVTSLIRSLLVKSATLGKTASGEPVLPVIFARTLHDVAPDIARCLAITYWPGDREMLLAAAIRQADVVVVYGGADAVANVSRRIAPEQRLVVHGPRISFGIVGEAVDTQVTRDVAHAVSAYEQQGCVSPHVVYVIGGEERARSFARAVAAEMARIAETMPRGVLSAEEAVAVRNARTAAEFGGHAELFGEESADYSVIYESDPGFRVSCLNRVLFVKAVADEREVLRLLPNPGLLQSAAIAGFAEKQKAELARALGLCGVSRITSFDRLPWPPMHWHHDGAAPLRELLWWQDIEP